jgi:predicted HAD superfamily Cof-like phosphohydrolase
MKQMTNYEKVRAFHKAFELDLDRHYSEERADLRWKLINEELDEMFDELYPKNLIVGPEETVESNLIKELADLLYVVYGTAATFGIDIDTAFNRVHESNMSKLGEDGKPIYREDGKVLKSKNYKPPVMDDLVPKGN